MEGGVAWFPNVCLNAELRPLGPVTFVAFDAFDVLRVSTVIAQGSAR
jgi:hypothetical protein